ncbi:hypothetical protein QQF64_006924 [Cirrhinus molitorella]|uniref:Uncharacterized protein n=1 Tax=Cirrhinus molitorella TaxID=172907 RepID=A0ABR3MCG2_9TELE
MVEYKPLTLNRWYVYPDWAYALGWLLALSSLLLVPGWALSRTCAGKGSLKQRDREEERDSSLSQGLKSPLPPAPIRTLEYSLITAALRGGYKAPVMDQCLGD